VQCAASGGITGGTWNGETVVAIESSGSELGVQGHAGGDAEPLLTPAEVASLFRVDPKTVTRWAKAGKLSCIRTLGGHRRYRASEVRQLLDGA
jgi:excisionase family DNA binding protein